MTTRNTTTQASQDGSPNTETANTAPVGDEQMAILRAISQGVATLGEEVRAQGEQIKAIGDRVTGIETKGRDDFKKGAKKEDIEAAAENRKGIDPKIVTVVDEILGTDFGIEMAPLGENQLGYMFTLVVPDRMNDNPTEKRPIKDEEGNYKKDAQGNVLMTNWQRPDRRSKVLSSADGYGAIREHCEKVRAYMVVYYTSQNKQMPALNVK